MDDRWNWDKGAKLELPDARCVFEPAGFPPGEVCCRLDVVLMILTEG